MPRDPDASARSDSDRTEALSAFDSELVDRVQAGGNIWQLKNGEILLPRVFGFCRGVKRALVRLEETCRRHASDGKRIFLLGEIIHNPWVNEFFRRRSVQILTNEQRRDEEEFIGKGDCAVIPAFGVPLEIENRLGTIGCEIVDTSCGDVRRLWVWGQQAAREGFGVLLFGKADHDETVVTKSRIEAAGGKYVVAGSLDEVRKFCRMIVTDAQPDAFRVIFNERAANSDSLAPFHRLAQASQTTMLYDDTMEVRRAIREAFAERFGDAEADRRLQFQPTVCRATQDRQTAAVELCRARPDLVVVVGGFGSSNTRNLYRLASSYTQAYFIEDASAISSPRELRSFDVQSESPVVVPGWLPVRRPLRVGILAGASSPRIVIGQVLQRLAGFLGGE